MQKKIIVGALVVFLIAAAAFVHSQDSGFKLDTLFMKVTVKEGESAVNNVEVANIGEPRYVSMRIIGIKDIASIDIEEFYLALNDVHASEVEFNAENTRPGVYLGKLEIFSDKESKEIPIILEIQSKEILFDSNINLFPKGDFSPGDTASIEIKIFDLAGMGVSDIDFTYSLKDFSGEEIISEKEGLIVDGKLTFAKTISLPGDLKTGDYVLAVTTEYDGHTGTSSLFFKVIENVPEESGGGQFPENNLLYIMIGFFFLIFLILFFYIIFSRDRLLRELQKQYDKELRNQRKLIREQQTKMHTRLETPAERRTYKKELREIKKQRLKALGEMQRERLDKYRKIKKRGTATQLERQLKKWKAQGYDTGVLEKKYKFPNIASIKNKIKKWKAQGYDTGVLEKKVK